jgi:aspartate/methionine/tyrosine aminotransferase
VSDDSPRARQAVRRLGSNQIRDVANAAMGTPDLLPLWFGESDMATPQFICAAGIGALQAGETFYAPNLGDPALREDIAGYVSRLHGRIDRGRIAVTSSGVSALMLTLQALVAPGDRVIVVTPVWPNLFEMPRILAAEVTCVPLRFGPRGWALDLDRLLDSLEPGVRAVLINSPNNPTGWTISRDEQQALLRRCREIGAWIVADDVYERLFFQGTCAPSFLDIATGSDRLVSCNSFSKAWRMTGWRIGWAVLPGEVPADFEKLIEFNTSCVPQFVQRAARAALRDGEGDVAFLVERIAANQLNARRLLADMPQIELGEPASGAMYLFMRVRGLRDSLELCRQLVARGRLGLAPGSAFGEEASGFLRWCLAVDGARLEEGVRRFRRFIEESWPSLGPR